MDNAAGSGTVPDRDREFDRLVEEYQRPVLRMCFLTLRDRTLAEDAAQETFLKVYRTMDAFRGECSEKTWIMKIAVRTCYDMNRSGWFRFMNRRVTPDMLPEQAAEESDPRDDELTAALKKTLPKDVPCVMISSVARTGLEQLKDLLWKAIND